MKFIGFQRPSYDIILICKAAYALERRKKAMTEELKQTKKDCVDVESIGIAIIWLTGRKYLPKFQHQAEKKGQSQ